MRIEEIQDLVRTERNARRISSVLRNGKWKYVCSDGKVFSLPEEAVCHEERLMNREMFEYSLREFRIFRDAVIKVCKELEA